MRKHLDGFEKATGDPLFIVKDIEKLLDSAGAASGTVTLDAAKLAALKEQLGQDQGRRRRHLDGRVPGAGAECEVPRDRHEGRKARSTASVTSSLGTRTVTRHLAPGTQHS